MIKIPYITSHVTEKDRQRKKQFLMATLVTCLVLAFIGGTIHVVQLGANRMEDMRAQASYDLEYMSSRIRAAGEDLHRHRAHKAGDIGQVDFALVEIEAMLDIPVWQDIDRLIDIPAGSFSMGTSRKLSDPQDRPAHQANVAAYRISKYPVTNAQYARFVAATKHRPPQNWDRGSLSAAKLLHPVTMVSWFDGQQYCGWIGGRLPKETEWEKAARGTDGRRWPWGNHMEVDRLNTYYSVGSTSDVTRFTNGASIYGVMDMAGNVTEWIGDYFSPYDGSDASEDIFKARVGVVKSHQDKVLKVVELVEIEERYRVMRGGSWKSDPFSTASYHRNFGLPNYASDFYGFRCVVEVQSNRGLGQ